MKNLMVANMSELRFRYTKDNIERLLKAQIENSIDLNWKPKNIILLANFDFEFMKVKSIKIPLNDFCWTGSKVFAVKWLFENIDIKDILWVHDLDCWQNVEFKCPKIKDIGITTYSRPKYNGGSIFWTCNGKDILDAIVDSLVNNKASREEPTLNKILKSDTYKKRVTVVNQTFNVGCSGFVKRYNASIKPIHVCHFHPYNRIAWETHTMDRNQIDEIPVSRRLERLIRKYYIDLPIKLKGDHKKNEVKFGR